MDRDEKPERGLESKKPEEGNGSPGGLGNRWRRLEPGGIKEMLKMKVAPNG
jgi:hypothetical protein